MAWIAAMSAGSAGRMSREEGRAPAVVMSAPVASGSLGGERRPGAAQLPDQPGQVLSQALEPGAALDRPLVHVQAAIDLDLQGVNAVPWPAVMLGDEAAGIGGVAEIGRAHV